jgi:DNA replication protein DnaC
MFNNATLRQLHDLRMGAMAASFKEQMELFSANKNNIKALSFEERFGLLVEAEWLHRRNKRIERLIRQAGFRFSAAIEDIDYMSKKGINKADILKHSLGNYIKKAHNVFFCGPTGVGKTYLACALGRAACAQGFQVLYTRLPDYFRCVLAVSEHGRQPHFRDKYAKTSLLILDDWGLKNFTLDETAELSELFERRYGRASTIISSQVPSTAWHELFPDPTQADSILDRIVHNAYSYNITGESMRKTIGKQSLENADS